MRIILLIFLMACAAEAAPSAPDDSKAFMNAQALDQWARTSTAAGGSWKLFTYHKQWFYVVFRSHASNTPAIEPFVFVKSRVSGRWVRWLHLQTCRFWMDASVEGQSLIFWHLEQTRERSATQTEFLRVNLADLDAGSPWATGVTASR